MLAAVAVEIEVCSLKLQTKMVELAHIWTEKKNFAFLQVLLFSWYKLFSFLPLLPLNFLSFCYSFDYGLELYETYYWGVQVTIHFFLFWGSEWILLLSSSWSVWFRFKISTQSQSKRSHNNVFYSTQSGIWKYCSMS